MSDLFTADDAPKMYLPTTSVGLAFIRHVPPLVGLRLEAGLGANPHHRQSASSFTVEEATALRNELQDLLDELQRRGGA